MFNFNYLNHDFIEYIGRHTGIPQSEYTFYICNKCNIEIYYQSFSMIYYFHGEDDILKLTCDEMIIKNIIE